MDKMTVAIQDERRYPSAILPWDWTDGPASHMPFGRPGSWVIVDRATGLAVFETFELSTAGRINEDRYDVVPVLRYLSSLND